MYALFIDHKIFYILYLRHRSFKTLEIFYNDGLISLFHSVKLFQAQVAVEYACSALLFVSDNKMKLRIAWVWVKKCRFNCSSDVAQNNKKK